VKIALLASVFLLGAGACSFSTGGQTFNNLEGGTIPDGPVISREAPLDGPVCVFPDAAVDMIQQDTQAPDTVFTCSIFGDLTCNNACNIQDVTNCGTCGTACDLRVTDTCSVDGAGAGSCTCGGNAPCTGANVECCNGQCVDITSDAANCGGCGNACSGTFLCVAGSNGPVCQCGKSADCGAFGPVCNKSNHCVCGVGSDCDFLYSDACSSGAGGASCTCAGGPACDPATSDHCDSAQGSAPCRCGNGPACTSPQTCTGGVCI
jgi:hypothetical protein